MALKRLRNEPAVAESVKRSCCYSSDAPVCRHPVQAPPYNRVPELLDCRTGGLELGDDRLDPVSTAGLIRLLTDPAANPFFRTMRPPARLKRRESAFLASCLASIRRPDAVSRVVPAWRRLRSSRYPAISSPKTSTRGSRQQPPFAADCQCRPGRLRLICGLFVEEPRDGPEPCHGRTV